MAKALRNMTFDELRARADNTARQRLVVLVKNVDSFVDEIFRKSIKTLVLDLMGLELYNGFGRSDEVRIKASHNLDADNKALHAKLRVLATLKINAVLADFKVPKRTAEKVQKAYQAEFNRRYDDILKGILEKKASEEATLKAIEAFPEIDEAVIRQITRDREYARDRRHERPGMF